MVGKTLPNELMTNDSVEQYREDGYTIIRDVFSKPEIEQMKTAVERRRQFGQLL